MVKGVWVSKNDFLYLHLCCSSVSSSHHPLLRTLADLNECRAKPGICKNGRCINTVGSYRCECNDGFEPSLTGTECIGKLKHRLCRRSSNSVIQSNTRPLFLSFRQQERLLLHRGSADYVPAVLHQQKQRDEVGVLLQRGSRLGSTV